MLVIVSVTPFAVIFVSFVASPIAAFIKPNIIFPPSVLFPFAVVGVKFAPLPLAAAAVGVLAC